MWRAIVGHCGTLQSHLCAATRTHMSSMIHLERKKREYICDKGWRLIISDVEATIWPYFCYYVFSEIGDMLHIGVLHSQDILIQSIMHTKCATYKLPHAQMCRHTQPQHDFPPANC